MNRLTLTATNTHQFDPYSPQCFCEIDLLPSMRTWSALRDKVQAAWSLGDFYNASKLDESSALEMHLEIDKQLRGNDKKINHPFGKRGPLYIIVSEG